MNSLRRIENALTRVEGAILVLVVSVMVVLAFVQVVLRNTANWSNPGADVFLRRLVLWAGLLGGAIATARDRHITIDLLGRALRGRWKTAGALLGSLFSLGVTILLVGASWRLVREVPDTDRILFGIPAWSLQYILPVGFALVGLHFALKAAMHAVGLTRPQEEAKA